LLQHILPRGFRKVRSYGFLHPCSKKLIKFLQMVLRVNPVRMFKKIRFVRQWIPASQKQQMSALNAILSLQSISKINSSTAGAV
jgi:hypothetical protein